MAAHRDHRKRGCLASEALARIGSGEYAGLPAWMVQQRVASGHLEVVAW